MYAQCPNCKTVFSLTPEQLEAAEGRVRCGQCLNAFRAHEHLVEELAELTLGRSSAETEAPPSDQVLRTERSLPETDDDVPTVLPTQPPFQFGDEIIESPLPPGSNAVLEPARRDAGDPLTDHATRSAGDLRSASARVAKSSTKTALPDLLREDVADLLHAPQPRWYVRLAQFMLALLLTLTLAAQFAWFMPKQLLQRFPEARPWLDLMYRKLGKELPVPRDPSRILLLSRDVRVHPEHKDVLVVNAKLTNNAAFPQPYPTVHLTLFGVNGRVIGARGFRPQDYLTPGVDRADGMVPEVPVQIGFQVAVPETVVVSYEFKFL